MLGFRMCGRYVIKTPPGLLRETFGYAEQPNFPPRYNVAPTQPIPVVRLDNGRRSFALVRWGLIPACGFYEWKPDGTRKRPFFAATERPVAFAGLWEPWIGPNGEEVETACI